MEPVYMDNRPLTIKEQKTTEQVCTIQIACVVTSDDEAMTLKQAITIAVSNIQKKRVSFTLTDGAMPTNPNMR